MKIDTLSTVPYYEQLYDQFVQYISQGILQVGDKLPSVRSLSSQVHANPNTIQKTYALLEQAGYVESMPGKGSYVCDVTSKLKETVFKEVEENVRTVVLKSQHIGLSYDELCQIIKKEWGMNDDTD